MLRRVTGQSARPNIAVRERGEVRSLKGNGRHKTDTPRPRKDEKIRGVAKLLASMFKGEGVFDLRNQTFYAKKVGLFWCKKDP